MDTFLCIVRKLMQYFFYFFHFLFYFRVLSISSVLVCSSSVVYDVDVK